MGTIIVIKGADFSKSALKKVELKPMWDNYYPTYSIGAIESYNKDFPSSNDGQDVDSLFRIRTDFLQGQGFRYKINIGGDYVLRNIICYNDNQTGVVAVANEIQNASLKSYIFSPSYPYFRFVVNKKDGSEVELLDSEYFDVQRITLV